VKPTGLLLVAAQSAAELARFLHLGDRSSESKRFTSAKTVPVQRRIALDPVMAGDGSGGCSFSGI